MSGELWFIDISPRQISKHNSSRFNNDVQLKVLDELFGWTGFRESYGNSTWRWLVAALSPKYEKRFWASSSLIGFLLYFSFRFLLSSASLSEESLCRVSGENKSISLNVILATYCLQYSNLCLIHKWTPFCPAIVQKVLHVTYYLSRVSSPPSH